MAKSGPTHPGECAHSVWRFGKLVIRLLADYAKITFFNKKSKLNTLTMALRDSDGKISGKINNIVYRGYKNKQVMQIAPTRVKQTLATKLSALEFGLAAVYAKAIRGVFHNIYEEYDGNMVRRLTATIAACIRTSDKEPGDRDLHDADLSPLIGFVFNTDAPFEKLAAVGPKLDIAPNGTIRFQMPPFIPNEDVLFPPNLVRPQGTFGIYVVAFNFVKSLVHVIDYAGFDIEEEEKESRSIDWTCEKSLPKGYIVIVLLSLRYFALNWLGQRAQTTERTFYPTIVLDAFHVTDEMAALGIDDGLTPPSEKDLSGLEKLSADSIKENITKLKAKK